MDKIFDIAIIGAGGAGQMAMLRAVLNHLDTVVFLGDANTKRRSRETWVGEVDNIPGMFDKKRPIVATTKEVIEFIEKKEDLKQKLTLIKSAASNIAKEDDVFTISSDKETVKARFAVLCTGTMDEQPLIQGSIEPIFPYANRGDVLYCIRCDGHRTVGHDTAVIGHHAGAGWIAIMLKERYDLQNIYVLTNGHKFEASDEVLKLLTKYGIPVKTEEITAILGDQNEGLKGFSLNEEALNVTRAFVALGSRVYNDLAKKLGVKLSERDHVLTNEKGETSVPGFYAAGDLVEGKKKQVYTAWDLAVDAVDSIDEKIRILKRGQ